MYRFLILLSLITSLASACTTGTSAPQAASTLAPDQTALTQTARFQSSGGGEPRSADYWLIWNTCAEGNMSETARANGGRDAGWLVMDDLLADPGIMVGLIVVDRCMQGIMLLQSRDANGADHSNDPAYSLAAQLFTAELNLAAGSETCAASDQVIYDAQILLEEIGFSGIGNYMGPPKASPNVETARSLTTQLASYNIGNLCVP